ncbi:hypothetical protein BC628DRAFT_653657 [Trametes gibbosa]|nr:hypothetical protein BC628DRAFT_653657 [Trametes gibbosa]
MSYILVNLFAIVVSCMWKGSSILSYEETGDQKRPPTIPGITILHAGRIIEETRFSLSLLFSGGEGRGCPTSSSFKLSYHDDVNPTATLPASIYLLESCANHA